MWKIPSAEISPPTRGRRSCSVPAEWPAIDETAMSSRLQGPNCHFNRFTLGSQGFPNNCFLCDFIATKKNLRARNSQFQRFGLLSIQVDLACSFNGLLTSSSPISGSTLEVEAAQRFGRAQDGTYGVLLVVHT